MRNALKSPSNRIYVNLTFQCNKNCNYCYTKIQRKANPNITLPQFANLLKWLGEQGIQSVVLTGGEPTQHPQFSQLLQLMRKNDFKVSILTNGIFKSKLLETSDSEIIRSYQIHYMLPDDYTNEEKKILETNLRNIRDKTNQVAIRHNIQATNTPYDHIIDVCTKYDIKFLSISLLTPNSSGTNFFIHFKELEKFKLHMLNLIQDASENGIKPVHTGTKLPLCLFTREERRILIKKAQIQWICSAGSNTFSLNPDLSVNPCPFFNDIQLPNILQYPTISDVRNVFSDAMEKLKWNDFITEDCKSCIYRIRKMCQGGCLTYKFLKNGQMPY